MPPPSIAAPPQPLSRAAAREQIAAATLVTCKVARVGLELEFHLFDLTDLERRPAWDRVIEAVTPGPVLPGGSRLTVEPGGQLELSAPPAPDLATAIRWARADEVALRSHCRSNGLGLLAWGADPLRPPERIHPGDRYVAMEQHYAASGHAESGRAMMTATASLQVNLDLGDGELGQRRWQVLSALAPLLTAVSACSPQLAGRRSGWASMRQQAWEGLDPRRCSLVQSRSGLPEAWAAYVLAAPTMMLADQQGGAEPVRHEVPLGSWLDDPRLLGRPATAAALAHHLTTLFPPVRPRGFVEVRSLDATGAAWWPGLAALTEVVCEESTMEQVWRICRDAAGPDDLPDMATAAREGLRNPVLRQAATAVVEVAGAAPCCPDVAQRSLERLLGQVRLGCAPGDRVQARIDEVGVRRAVREAIEADEEVDDV